MPNLLQHALVRARSLRDVCTAGLSGQVNRGHVSMGCSLGDPQGLLLVCPVDSLEVLFHPPSLTIETIVPEELHKHYTIPGLWVLILRPRPECAPMQGLGQPFRWAEHRNSLVKELQPLAKHHSRGSHVQNEKFMLEYSINISSFARDFELGLADVVGSNLCAFLDCQIKLSIAYGCWEHH